VLRMMDRALHLTGDVEVLKILTNYETPSLVSVRANKKQCLIIKFWICYLVNDHQPSDKPELQISRRFLI